MPVSAELHEQSNRAVLTITAFPHEDVLARTSSSTSWSLLGFASRLEVDAGREASERLPYVDTYGVSPSAKRLEFDDDALYRQSPDSMVYPPLACPGIGISTVKHTFPVMHTLLSLPFAVLHQMLRLTSMEPLTSYQSDVLRLAMEIARL
ncbi:hypothetical protein C8R46DRAFT_1214605 [Mycena filopes]|nr:hypothetical protein C8R46DRAFT_1214605 [Mycena filopes]